MFNEEEPEKRTRKDVTWSEYITGEYVDYDENGNILSESFSPQHAQVSSSKLNPKIFNDSIINLMKIFIELVLV